MNHIWEHIVKYSKIGEEFSHASLDQAMLLPQGLIEDCRQWIRCPNKNLILFGNTGAGKSYVLHALARNLALRNLYSIVVNSLELDTRLSMASQNRSGGEKVSDIIPVYAEAPFLFLDDVGMEISGERMQRNYYRLFDYRYIHHKPWVISTNCDQAELEQRFGYRTASRMSRSLTIEFPKKDLRKDIDINLKT